MSSRTAQSQREQARLAARREQAKRARNARLSAAGALVLVGAAVAGLVIAQTDSGRAAAPSDGVLTGPPPWPAQKTGLEKRISSLGFPPVGDESYHAHALLSVFRNGEQVPVPADLGYDETGRHSSLHTHTPDGVIHMEADDPYPYTVAHVMTTWGVAFSSTRLGGDLNADGKQVHVYVNGKPATPVAELEDGDNVVVAYGTQGSFPTEPPTDALEGA